MCEMRCAHTMVIACVTVISEPLGKLPIRLVRRLAKDESILGRDLFERSRRDRAPYTLWRDQGLLIATGG